MKNVMTLASELYAENAKDPVFITLSDEMIVSTICIDVEDAIGKKLNDLEFDQVKESLLFFGVGSPSCPTCNKPLNFKGEHRTDWYGVLKYYKCKSCKDSFVSQNNGELNYQA